MSNKTTRTRDEITQECANAAIACWQHYSDNLLNDVHKDHIKAALYRCLPVTVSISEWQKYAKMKETEYKAEEDLEIEIDSKK